MTNINKDNTKFTIEYTKEELNKITLDFLTQMNEYIARVNNIRVIITTREEEEIENRKRNEQRQ